MRRRTVALLAMVVMAVAMLAASAPAFGQGVGGCDPNPGASEGSSAPIGTPTQGKPGAAIRDPIANERDQHDTRTGFGLRVDERAECA
jgi:hypothetical protein